MNPLAGGSEQQHNSMLMSSHHLPAPRSQHDLQVADGQGHAVKGQGKAVKWQSRTGSEMTVNGQAAAVKRRVERSRKAVEWPVRGQRKAVNEWPDLVGGRAVHAREVNRDRPAAARQPAGDLGRCHHVARRRQWVDCVGLLRRGRRTTVKLPPPPPPLDPLLYFSLSHSGALTAAARAIISGSQTSLRKRKPSSFHRRT